LCRRIGWRADREKGETAEANSPHLSGQIRDEKLLSEILCDLLPR